MKVLSCILISIIYVALTSSYVASPSVSNKTSSRFFKANQTIHNEILDSAIKNDIRKISQNTKPTNPFLWPYIIELIGSFISIITAVVLITWFVINRWQVLSSNYFNEIKGNYSGFTKPINQEIEIERNGRINSGILMNILDVDSNGFFRGELRYGENLTTTHKNAIHFHQIRDGIHVFSGKLEYKFSYKKRLHPFKPELNRQYFGKLYIVHRLDFLYDEYKFEDYYKAEYDIIHYRDMKTLRFTFCKLYDNGELDLPLVFSLDRNFSFTFGPYTNVKEIAFRGDDELNYTS